MKFLYVLSFYVVSHGDLYSSYKLFLQITFHSRELVMQLSAADIEGVYETQVRMPLLCWSLQ